MADPIEVAVPKREVVPVGADALPGIGGVGSPSTPHPDAMGLAVPVRGKGIGPVRLDHAVTLSVAPVHEGRAPRSALLEAGGSKVIPHLGAVVVGPALYGTHLRSRHVEVARVGRHGLSAGGQVRWDGAVDLLYRIDPATAQNPKKQQTQMIAKRDHVPKESSRSCVSTIAATRVLKNTPTST